VKQAFAATSGEAGASEATVPAGATVEGRGGVPPAEPDVAPDTSPASPEVTDVPPETLLTAPVDAPDGPEALAEVLGRQNAEREMDGEDGLAAKGVQPEEPLPARMLNEFVYCPRLFYYEYVEAVFVESADTVKGAAVHARVDKGKGALAMPEGEKPPTESEAGDDAKAAGGAEAKKAPKGKAPEEEIHARSVMLGSERLGVVAKMDLVEATLTRDGTVAAVQPVDYKVGAPREGTDGRELWDADKMQLGCNASSCAIMVTPAIRGSSTTGRRSSACRWSGRRSWRRGSFPRSPRRGSARRGDPAAAGRFAEVRAVFARAVCLPDETRMLSIPTVENFAPAAADGGAAPVSGQHAPSAAPRRLMAQRDEKKALYLNTPGFRVGCNDAC